MARDLSTYLEHIRVNAESTQRLFGTAYRSFAGIEEFIGSGPNNDEIYDYLQKWINGSKNDPATKRTYFSLIKQYLHYRGVKMHPTDIRQCLNFPTKHEEEMHPLGIDEFRRILEECGHKRGGDVPCAGIKRDEDRGDNTDQAGAPAHGHGQDNGKDTGQDHKEEEGQDHVL